MRNMSDIESEFLLAVERGELDTLRQFLRTKSYTRLDINCRDPLDRNALIIGIDNKNLEAIKLLLETDIRVGDALLYAIQENFVEAVELLLDHSNSGKPNSGHQNQHDSYEEEYCFFSCDMTPLMLAAQKNNLEIIKLLLDRNVSPVRDPHDPRCGCGACCQARSRDCLKHSRSRINAYRALSSPSLMALSSADPLKTAFEMSAKLEDLAQLEPEHKEDYMRFRARCQKFATKLLDYTRTSTELETLLDFNGQSESESDSESEFGSGSSESSDEDEDKDGVQRGAEGRRRCGRRSKTRLARLKLAIQCKQKTFCAHPNIQELLATMWYENLPGFRRMNVVQQTLQVLCIGLMFPVYSLAYLVAPKSQFGLYIKKPFIKFICHSASYITFIAFLVMASQRVEAFYCWSAISSLFVATDPSPHHRSELFNLASGDASNFSLFHEAIIGPPPSSYNYDDSELNQLAAIYKHTMSQASAAALGSSSGGAGGVSTARGLDSLSKIFEELPASSKRRGALPSPIESIILIWVFSLLWAELKQIRSLGINYYRHDMWNLLDSVASAFYIGTIILRIVSYLQSDEKSIGVAREHWHAYDPTLISEGLFATGTIFSSLKLVYIFSVNPYLGPLQISLGRMIIDILRFSWIYGLVLFAFACGMNQLLWYYADLERHQCLNVTNYNLAQYYKAKQNLHVESLMSSPPQTILGGSGTSTSTTPLPTTSTTTAAAAAATAALQVALNGSELALNGSNVLPGQPINSTQSVVVNEDGLIANITDENLMESAFDASLEDDSSKPPITIDDSCKTWRHFSNVFESSQTLFWANFGLVDLENFDLTGIRQYTRFWALLMFGCYCFINVIVVLNLLIAMMNHSYVKISTRSDIEWKFARTRLWMSYFEHGSTVPAPFNIIPSLKSISVCLRHAYSHLLALYRSWCGCLGAVESGQSATLGNNTKAHHHIPTAGYRLGSVARPTQSLVIHDPTKPPPPINTQHRHVHSQASLAAKPQRNSISWHPDVVGVRRELNNNNNTTKTDSKRTTTTKRSSGRRSQINYETVIKSLVRRYLVDEQRQVEKQSALTEVKLKRWSKLNVFT